MQKAEIVATAGPDADHDTQSPEEDILFLNNDADDSQAIGPWARLDSVERLYPSIQISEDGIVLGRADVEGNKAVSKSHCRIHKDPSGQIILKNLSCNGTIVKGVMLGKDDFTAIQHGDEVVLGPYRSGCPLYVFKTFNMTAEEAVLDRKRTCEGSDSDPSQLESRKRIKISETMDTLKCCICLNIWHDAVSVTPCLHSFCNGCFSEWYKNKRMSRCNCPQCREPVVSVRRNHTLCNLVESFLQDCPSLKRSPEDIANLEATALVGNDTMKLHSGYVSSSDDDGSNEGEQWDSDHCPQCLGSNALEDLVFHCGPQMVHLTCSACNLLMPQRLDLEVPQKCAGCHRVFCCLYWQSQNMHRPNGVVIGCSSSEILKPMNERRISELPSGTFRGNSYERDVTRRYMSEQRLEIQDVICEWLSKMDRGEIKMPHFSGSHDDSFTSGSYICNQCADTVTQHLLYNFRLSVPRNDLPPDAAGREDCWYGRLCRTQLHKISHARKYNHACEPTSRASHI